MKIKLKRKIQSCRKQIVTMLGQAFVPILVACFLLSRIQSDKLIKYIWAKCIQLRRLKVQLGN